MYSNDNSSINCFVSSMFTEEELADFNTDYPRNVDSVQVESLTEEEQEERINHYIAVHEEEAIYQARYVAPGTVEHFFMQLSVEDQRHVEAIIEDAAAYLARGEVARNYRGWASFDERHAEKEKAKAINQLFDSSLDELLDVATKEQLAYLTSIIK
jgi:hypothetical protein